MPDELEARKDFFAALGQLIATWADVELELYRVLIHYAGVSDGIGRALFSGSRAKQMIVFIEAFIHNGEISDVERIADLKHVFPQTQLINGKRDELAHNLSDISYGIDPNRPDGRAYTNAFKVSRYGNEKVWFIQTTQIKEMVEDLHAVINHLGQHYGRSQENGFHPWREDPADDVPTPWLYKSPQPEKMARRNR